MVPSGEERETLLLRTDAWEHVILGSLSNFGPVERLNAIRELIMVLREILLQPISSEIESAAEAALLSID